MLTLHHGRGSLASQKVRLTLAEKGASWESHVIAAGDRRSPDYLKINRNGLVPSLEHDGQVVIESRVINEYLDELFPTPPLRPAAPLGRARVHAWTAQDDQLHLHVFTLSFLVGMRHELTDHPPEEWPARAPGLTDPVKRERAISLARFGFASPYPADAVVRFRALFADMDQALQLSPWLAGDQYSLAETDMTPYLYRLRSLGLKGLWDGHPRVEDWFERVQARPSFPSAILDWYNEDDFARAERSAAAVREDISGLLAQT